MNSKLIGLALVLLAVTLESFGHLFMKCGATEAAAQPFPAVKLNKEVWVALGLTLLAIEAVVYTLALHRIDVSIAFPMSSLSFVGIALLSALMLRESVTRKRWLGIGLILIGSCLLGAS